MAIKPTTQDIAKVALDFLTRLPYPKKIGPKEQFLICVGGFPGSGKTTVATEFSAEAGNCFHVQANDARVLLADKNFKWGEDDNHGVYVRQVLAAVLKDLTMGGHSVVLDGSFVDPGNQELREAVPGRVRRLLVAVTCPVEIAQARADKRYRTDLPPEQRPRSRFGDWRASDFGAYKDSMAPRREKLEHLLEEDHSIKVIMNHGSKEDIANQVRRIWREFNAI